MLTQNSSFDEYLEHEQKNDIENVIHFFEHNSTLEPNLEEITYERYLSEVYEKLAEFKKIKNKLESQLEYSHTDFAELYQDKLHELVIFINELEYSIDQIGHLQIVEKLDFLDDVMLKIKHWLDQLYRLKISHESTLMTSKLNV